MFRMGVVLVPEDLKWSGWKKTFGPVFKCLNLHGSTAKLVEYVKTKKWKDLLRLLERRDVDVEYIIHICSDFVPRSLFGKNPELFRMDGEGRRTPNANFCPSSPDVIGVIDISLTKYLKSFKPTTGRYHFLPDDSQPWCSCPRCRRFSVSDQQLMFSNILAKLLRQRDDAARIMYCSYKPAHGTPQVKAEPNVFLGYAPIERNYRIAFADRRSPVNASLSGEFPDLMKHFGERDSEVFEYWLDVSRFSNWKRPACRINVPNRVIQSDLRFYSSAGFENISVLGVWLDKTYVKTYDDAPLRNFIEVLSTAR